MESSEFAHFPAQFNIYHSQKYGALQHSWHVLTYSQCHDIYLRPGWEWNFDARCLEAAGKTEEKNTKNVTAASALQA